MRSGWRQAERARLEDLFISQVGSGKTKKCTMLNPLEHPICLASPRRLVRLRPAWQEHIPFAMLLSSAQNTAYRIALSAVSQLNLQTRCYAIDAWKGDPHAGYYGPDVLADLRAHHDPLYGNSPTLMQSTFYDALRRHAERPKCEIFGCTERSLGQVLN